MLNRPALDKRNPWMSIMLLFFLFLICVFLGDLLGRIILIPFIYSGLDIKIVLQQLEAFPNQNRALLLYQFISTSLPFVIAPVIYIRFFEGAALDDFTTKPNKTYLWVLIIPITLGIMLGQYPIITWNEHIHFPQALSHVEQLFRALENQALVATNYLTDYHHSLGYFAFCLIVIGIFPAVGEELFFRGIIQKQFQRITKNPHVAIFLTGFLFSAIHFQFFGFFPRMILGILFGYLYYWSGNILMPILGHFINNGLTLLFFFLFQEGIIAIDLNNESSISWYIVLFSLLLGGYSLYIFKKEQRPLRDESDR